MSYNWEAMNYNWEVQNSVLEYCTERWPLVKVSRIWLRELIHDDTATPPPPSIAQVEFNDGSITELELDGSRVVDVTRTFQ